VSAARHPALARAGRWLDRVGRTRLLLLASALALLVTIMVLPMASLFEQAFLDNRGAFVGFDNFVSYLTSAGFRSSLINTVFIATTTTLIAVPLGFFYAFALSRTTIKAKRFFRYIAMLPIFMPTVVHALGLIYLFGRQGIVTRFLGVESVLSGPVGIITALTVWTFPQAFLMFSVALEYAAGRFYEAAESLGVKPLTQLLRITLPEIKYTFINACFVVFTLSFTDFGAPRVVGGNFNVLATDIFNQVIGQFNMGMGAVVGTVLIMPALVSFVVGRLTSSRNSGAMNSRSTALTIRRGPWRDTAFFTLCALVTVFVLGLIAALAVGALSTFYPFDLTFTLSHFDFQVGHGGIAAFTNSVLMATLTAAIGTAFVFVFAYATEKTDGAGPLVRFARLLASIPVALPGMVIGLAFIFFFNDPGNPLGVIHGTVAILVVANVLNFFAVPYITASGALKKLDREFEAVADSLSIPRWKLFFRVTVPMSVPALLEIFMYYFVSAMVTISAMVFLSTPQFPIAAVAITHMEEAGNLSGAAAMSLLILLVNILVRLAYEVAVRLITARTTRKETHAHLDSDLRLGRHGRGLRLHGARGGLRQRLPDARPGADAGGDPSADGDVEAGARGDDAEREAAREPVGAGAR